VAHTHSGQWHVVGPHHPGLAPLSINIGVSKRKAASRITSMVAIAGWTCRSTPQSQTRRNRCGTCTLTRYPPSPVRHRSTLLSTACGRARGLCDGATTLTSAMCSGVQAWGLCAAAASGGATRYLRFHPHAWTGMNWQVENGTRRRVATHGQSGQQVSTRQRSNPPRARP